MSDIIQGKHIAMALVTVLTLRAMPFDTERKDKHVLLEQTACFVEKRNKSNEEIID